MRPKKVEDSTKSIRTHSRYTGNIYVGLYNKKLIFDLGSSQYDLFSDEENKKIIKKISIVEFTLKSLKQEKIFSDEDIDFKPLAISWLWIKGYYCIFHLISIIIAFERKDPRYIFDKNYNSHIKIQKIINEYLAKKPFNEDFLNKVFLGRDLESFTTGNFENLRTITSFDDSLYKLSIKKAFKDDRDSLKNKRLKSYSFFGLAVNYRERFNYQGFQYLEFNSKTEEEEVDKFYMTSYDLIIKIIESLICYLAKNTQDEIKTKLNSLI